MKQTLIYIIAIFGVAILLIGATLNSGSYSKEITLVFDENTLQEFKDLQKNIGENREFVGFLYLENDNLTVKDWSLIGYKELKNEDSILFNSLVGNLIVNKESEISDITIHSHPGDKFWSCWISPIDKTSLEEVVCIYCKENVKCYQK